MCVCLYVYINSYVAYVLTDDPQIVYFFKNSYFFMNERNIEILGTITFKMRTKCYLIVLTNKHFMSLLWLVVDNMQKEQWKVASKKSRYINGGGISDVKKVIIYSFFC